MIFKHWYGQIYIFRLSLWGPLACFPLVTRVIRSEGVLHRCCTCRHLLWCIGRQGSPWTIGCEVLSLMIAVGPLGPCTIFCRAGGSGLVQVAGVQGQTPGTNRLVLGVQKCGCQCQCWLGKTSAPNGCFQHLCPQDSPSPRDLHP